MTNEQTDRQTDNNATFNPHLKCTPYASLANAKVAIKRNKTDACVVVVMAIVDDI